MIPMIVDTHTHLFVEEFADDFEATVERARAAGVEKLFMPNIDGTTIDALLEACRKFPGVCYPMLGLHPTSVTESFRDDLRTMEVLLRQPNPYIAIGEVGLDLYWDTTYRREQMEAFDTQIRWALEYDLPLVIHSRKAFAELMECLEPYRHTPLRGIFHSFTGDDGDVSSWLSFDNFLLGINGVVTFKKAVLPAVLKSRVPLERLVVETDSPYLAPVPHRGGRNESAYVKDVLQKVADIYEVSLEEAARVTTENALRLFRIARP